MSEVPVHSKRPPTCLVFIGLVIGGLILLMAYAGIKEALGPSATPVPTPPTGIDVSRASFGEEWPFNVDQGVLSCEGQQDVVFHANGKRYGVNAPAAERDHNLTTRSILLSQNTLNNPGLFRLIDMGLELCKN